jgi:hypothetical protein
MSFDEWYESHALASGCPIWPSQYDAAKSAWDAVVNQRMTTEQPAAPAETCIGGNPTCPCQDGDACHYKDAPGSKAMPIPAAPADTVKDDCTPNHWCNGYETHLPNGEVCNHCGSSE